MNLDEILIMWEADSEIDDNHLDNASIYTAKLHSKYLRLLINSKLKKTKIETEYNTLRKLKIRYYRGEMTRVELNERGWEQYQYNKPLKAEMDEFLKGDDDLLKILSRIEYINANIYALESIMAHLKQRDWQIRNALSWKQFLAGG